jgi:hypothetical protein
MACKRFAQQYRDLHVGGIRNVAVDFTGVLDASELLTGTPTVTDSSGELAIGGVQVSSVAMLINGVSVPAGRAVAFSVERGAAPEGDYELDILAATDAGQQIPGTVVIRCR